MYQINEEVSNTHGKRERVKIPLLPNRVGKRSGTMTMVMTVQLNGKWIYFLNWNWTEWHLIFQDPGTQTQEDPRWRALGEEWVIWFDLSRTGDSWKIFLWNRALELLYKWWRFRPSYSQSQTRKHQWKRSVQVWRFQLLF